ncbi:MAG: porin family protein [Flavobacteriaceae bacterium]|nr:porin family protein [Flavobacteriaceae bacterium]
MRKALLILGLVISYIVNAQDLKKEEEKSSLGIKGGYNLASVRNADGYETSQRQGFSLGVYGESYFTNFLSIQPELIYSQQGYAVEGSSYKLTQKINYINFPLMFKLYPSKIFYAEVGPQIGYAISHKEKTETFILENTREFEPKSFDWGLNLGTGFKSESGLVLGARYHHGLGKIYDETNYYNKVIQLFLGFEF